MQQTGLVPCEFLQQVLIRKHCVTSVILLNIETHVCNILMDIGMSGNKAKTVTTRYRQKDLNGDILYEGTTALPTCKGKSFICIVFTHINHDFCIDILYLQNNNTFMSSGCFVERFVEQCRIGSDKCCWTFKQN